MPRTPTRRVVGWRDEAALQQVGPVIGPSSRDRRARSLGPTDPAQPLGTHEPVDRAAGDAVPVAIQRGVDLTNPVHAVVPLVHRIDRSNVFRVAGRASGRRTVPRGVVGARGDRQACLTQDPTDRLDPEPLTVLVDVVDEHRRAHLILWSTSAAAKKPALDSNRQRNSAA